MDYKYYSLNDATTGKELSIHKNLQTLELVIRKFLDLEQAPIDQSDIDSMLDLFSKIPHFESRSPYYFCLGYIALRSDWNTIWKLEKWLSKWLGVSLISHHTIRYYRYLNRQSNIANLCE